MKISLKIGVSLVDARYKRAGSLDISRVLSRLKKIASAAGELLQAINQSVLSNPATDYRSKCWLSGADLKTCFAILRQVANLADTPEGPIFNLKKEVDRHEEPRCLLFEHKVSDVIALFELHWDRFRPLLLAADLR